PHRCTRHGRGGRYRADRPGRRLRQGLNIQQFPIRPLAGKPDRRTAMRGFLVVIFLLSTGADTALAAGSESVGTDVAIALPLIAGVSTLAKDDWKGSAKLRVTPMARVALAYGLKHVIREQRPDKSDFQSMPSDTSALAFAPAQFLWDRYGWEYGVPAYA